MNGGRVDGKNGLHSVNEGGKNGICGSVIKGTSAYIDGSSKDVYAETTVTFQQSCSNAGLDGPGCGVCVGGNARGTKEMRRWECDFADWGDRGGEEGERHVDWDSGETGNGDYENRHSLPERGQWF